MKKNTFKIIALVLIAVLITIIQILGMKRDKRNFNKFYSSEINGSIKDIAIKHHGVGFTINNDSNDYIFYPYTSVLNQNSIFNYFAEKGDSIIKTRYHDTLTLIKKDKRYLYTFQKR